MEENSESPITMQPARVQALAEMPDSVSDLLIDQGLMDEFLSEQLEMPQMPVAVSQWLESYEDHNGACELL